MAPIDRPDFTGGAYITGVAPTVVITTTISGTVNVAVLSSVQLNVNLAASAITLDIHEVGTANVAILSSVTLNITIAGSSISLPVTNPAGESLNIAIASSVTLNISIAASAIDVPITNPAGQSLNVAITSSVTINVAITSSSVTLNVNISSSGVSLNVVITGASATVSVTITNAYVQIFASDEYKTINAWSVLPGADLAAAKTFFEALRFSDRIAVLESGSLAVSRIHDLLASATWTGDQVEAMLDQLINDNLMDLVVHIITSSAADTTISANTTLTDAVYRYKTLTINSGKVLTCKAGTQVIIALNVINNGTITLGAGGAGGFTQSTSNNVGGAGAGGLTLVASYAKLDILNGSGANGGTRTSGNQGYAGLPGGTGYFLRIENETVPVGKKGLDTNYGGGGGAPTGVGGTGTYAGGAGGPRTDNLYDPLTQLAISMVMIATNWYVINVLSKSPTRTLTFFDHYGAGGGAGGGASTTNFGGGGGGQGGSVLAIVTILDTATITLNGGNGGNGVGTGAGGGGAAPGHCVYLTDTVTGIISITLTVGSDGTGGTGPGSAVSSSTQAAQAPTVTPTRIPGQSGNKLTGYGPF